jgi:hypothetical protein
MLNLRISGNGVEVERIVNGVSHWSAVDIQAFMKVLNEAVYNQIEEEVIESPLLPTGTLWYQEYKERKAYTVAMYREPRIAQMTFESRIYQVGYPGTVYKFMVTNNVVTNTYMWAVKDRVLKPDTEIFRYPFFNAYDTGRICMGSNHIEIEEPWQLHKMPDILTAMPSNNGLPTSNQSGLTGDSLLKAFEGKQFPNEWLTPLNQKLKNLFK